MYVLAFKFLDKVKNQELNIINLYFCLLKNDDLGSWGLCPQLAPGRQGWEGAACEERTNPPPAASSLLPACQRIGI